MIRGNDVNLVVMQSLQKRQLILFGFYRRIPLDLVSELPVVFSIEI
ncbi:MAG: hypothetical protein K9I92_04655 [Chitinophagaceae bacterium]|nr:hypothetical protein [Chitinophagaceae bacterium]